MIAIIMSFIRLIIRIAMSNEEAIENKSNRAYKKHDRDINIMLLVICYSIITRLNDLT